MRIAEVLCACAICALFSAFFAETGSVLLRLEQKNIYLSSSLERDKFICSSIEALLKDVGILLFGKKTELLLSSF